MRAAVLRALSLGLAANCGPAMAQEFSVTGFGDFRFIDSSDQRGWLDGGLGKTGFGGGNGHSDTDLTLHQVVAEGRAQMTPDLLAFASLRYGPEQQNAVDVLEGYVRYQPVDGGSLRWSVKLGAFFPPISLENEGAGWTSPWTLTPSAINSWVGEELRTIGGEISVEWRLGDTGSIETTGAVFGWNDPAGTLLADRGWAMDDNSTGLFGRLRMPNVIAQQFRVASPFYEQQPFLEIDSAPGWYAEASVHLNDIGKVTVLEYDNRGDPTDSLNGEFAWETRFTSAGAETYIGDVTLIAQAMTGSTVIAPSSSSRSTTYFQSAYLLAGWEIADWTLAGRVDVFATQESHQGSRADRSEHGHAFTLAATWKPLKWLSVTGEVLQLESVRTQRIATGLSPNQSETQFQLATKLLF